MNRQLSLIGAKVLIVDDSPEDRLLMEELFKDVEANPILAHSGEQALHALKNGNGDVDLILLDVILPEMDGVEVTRTIRSNENWDDIPIILVTSAPEGDHRIFQGIEVGANDYLKKPIDPMEMMARCISMLRQKRLSENNRQLQHLLELEVVERSVELEQTRDAALFGFAKLAETRDPDAKSHLDTIREICRVLAQMVRDKGLFIDEVDDSFVINIFKASPLHDIGKVAVPDSVLLKPGKLTSDEFEVMKKHSAIGARTLEDASRHLDNASFLAMARDIAYYHHEKWDGTGYPMGLKEDSIPVAARIMAIADVFDALSSKRVYKSAMNHQKVLDIITSSAGTHFDPELVDLFLENHQVFEEIKKKFKEDG